MSGGNAKEQKMIYVVEMLVNGEWKVWARYEEGCMGISAKERAESGLKTARCYGECRMIEIEK